MPAYFHHIGNRSSAPFLGHLRVRGRRSHWPLAIRKARAASNLCRVFGPGGRVATSQTRFPREHKDLLACLLWHLPCRWARARLRRRFAMASAVTQQITIRRFESDLPTTLLQTKRPP